MTTTLSGPATSPLDLLSLIRAGRHAAAEPAGSSSPLTADLERVPTPDSPVAVKVRIARNGKQLRRLGRVLAKAPDDATRAETEVAMRTLAQNLESARQDLAELVDSGRTRNWGPSDFEPGDQVRLLASWYDVLAVGPVGLTVSSRRPVTAGLAAAPVAAPVEYAKVTGRRRQDVEDVDALEDAA